MQRGSVLKKQPCRSVGGGFLPTLGSRSARRPVVIPIVSENGTAGSVPGGMKPMPTIFGPTISRKLDTAAHFKKAPASIKRRLRPALPRDFVQEVIGVEVLVIIEYLTRLLCCRVQETIRRQVLVAKEKIDPLITAKL
ncbi:MAG: hypothetical protein WCA08_20245 [Desulfoferrobacter sp.]